jgi:O-antigen/teichoic acid export membrane protein
MQRGVDKVVTNPTDKPNEAPPQHKLTNCTFDESLLMGMKGRMRRDTLTYAGAIAVDRLLGLILLPMLTRLLSRDDYGAWSQTGMTAGLLITVVLYAFPTVIVRHQAADSGPNARRRAFDRIGLLCVCLSFLWTLVALSAPSTVAHLIYGDKSYLALVPALLVWMFAEAAIEFAIAWWRVLGRIGVIAGVLVLRSTYRVSLAILMANFSDLPLSGWLLPYSLALAVLATFVLLSSRRAVRYGTHREGLHVPPPLRSQILEATPLVALSVLTALSGNIDRYLLAAWFSLNTVAVYAAAASLAAVPFMIHSVLGFTLFPAMSRQWALGQRAKATQLMNQSLLVYCFLSVPIALAVAGFGPWVLPWIATIDYQVEPVVFIGLSVSVLALGVQQILLYGLLLDGRGRQMLLLATLAVGLNLALALLLVPGLGMRGAALAAALTNLGLVTMTTRAVSAILDWRFPWRQTARIATHALLCAIPVVGLAALDLWAFSSVLTMLLVIGPTYLALDWWAKDSLLRHLIST